jgi:hypothetical protein
MRNKIEEEKKKVKVSITLNPELDKIMGELHKNKSKYIEHLIYRDLLKNNKINEDFII